MESPLLSIASFNARFEEHLTHSSTHRQAYEQTEQEVFELYNHHKYNGEPDGFESFRSARKRWLRARLAKNKAAS